MLSTSYAPYVQEGTMLIHGLDSLDKKLQLSVRSVQWWWHVVSYAVFHIQPQ